MTADWHRSRDADSLPPGYLADLVAFEGDPMTCAIAALPEMRPTFTIVGGKVACDLDGLLPHNARLNPSSSW